MRTRTPTSHRGVCWSLAKSVAAQTRHHSDKRRILSRSEATFGSTTPGGAPHVPTYPPELHP
eukprot:10803037-Prorocentrum_lima.AAC.1